MHQSFPGFDVVIKWRDENYTMPVRFYQHHGILIELPAIWQRYFPVEDRYKGKPCKGYMPLFTHRGKTEIKYGRPVQLPLQAVMMARAKPYSEHHIQKCAQVTITKALDAMMTRN